MATSPATVIDEIGALGINKQNTINQQKTAKGDAIKAQINEEKAANPNQ